MMRTHARIARSTRTSRDHRNFVVVLGMTVVNTKQQRSQQSSSIDAALLPHGVGPDLLRSDVIVSWNTRGTRPRLRRRSVPDVQGTAGARDDAPGDARCPQRDRAGVRSLRLRRRSSLRAPHRRRGAGGSRRARRAVSRPAGEARGANWHAGLHTSRTACCASGGSRLARPLRQRSSRCARVTAGISPAPTSSATVRAGIKRLRRGTASSRNRDFGSRNHSSSSTRSSSGRPLRRRCGPRRTPARSAKSRSTAPQTARCARTNRLPMPSGGWSSPRGRSIASRGNWRPIASSISGRRPACLRTSAWRSTTRTSRPGTRNTRTTTGVRTRPFGRRTPTGIRARHPTRSGSRSRPTPPFPEYTSAHAAACGASFGVLQQTFDDRGSFTMETTTAPPGMPTRTFASFRAAAAECADSRVRLGWHFRYSTDAGLALGRQIARYTQSRSLRPLLHGHDR